MNNENLKNPNKVNHFHINTNNKSNLFRDIILGSQDGLVNILGIALGLAAAGSSEKYIITAALAATFAESISMGAVAYTSFTAKKEFYDSVKKKVRDEIETKPLEAIEDLRQIYREKGLNGETLEGIVEKLSSDKEVWLKDVTLSRAPMEAESSKEIFQSSIRVTFATLIGSFIPLLPFFFIDVKTSLYIALTVSALFLFFIGVYKAISLNMDWKKSGVQMVLIGMLAALAGYLVGIIFNFK